MENEGTVDAMSASAAGLQQFRNGALMSPGISTV